MRSRIDERRLVLCRQAAKIRMSEPAKALSLFQKALLLEGGQHLTSAIHRHIANILGEKHELKTAEDHLLKSIALTPESELSSVDLFHLLEGQTRYRDALNEIRRFISLSDSVTYRELLSEGFKDEVSPELRAEADILRLVLEEHALKRVDVAMNHYKKQLATSAAPLEVLDALASEILGFGTSSLPDDSITDDWTDTGIKYREVGVILCKAKEWYVARDTLLRSVTLNNRDLRSWQWLCEAYRGIGDLVGAERALLSASANCSEQLISLRTLGWFYYVHKQPGKAISTFRQVIEHDPVDALSLEMLADSLLAVGELEESCDVINRCLEIEETSARQAILGDVAKRRGEFAVSNAAYQRALELDPSEESAILGLESFFKT